MDNFSIITVCYNSSETIAKTIESILSQDYKHPFEYIIIDGNSSDTTLAIINSYKLKFQNSQIRLKVISENDSGIYDAINKGITLSTGDIIGILNSDDWYDPSALSTVSSQLSKVSQDEFIIGGNVNIYTKSYRFVRIAKPLFPVEKKIYSYMSIVHPATFISKLTYERLGNYALNYSICSDYECMARFIHNKVPFIYMDIQLSNMRLGGASDYGENTKKIYHQIYSIQRMYKPFSIYNFFLYRYRLIMASASKIKRKFIPSKYV